MQAQSLAGNDGLQNVHGVVLAYERNVAGDLAEVPVKFKEHARHG